MYRNIITAYTKTAYPSTFWIEGNYSFQQTNFMQVHVLRDLLVISYITIHKNGTDSLLQKLDNSQSPEKSFWHPPFALRLPLYGRLMLSAWQGLCTNWGPLENIVWDMVWLINLYGNPFSQYCMLLLSRNTMVLVPFYKPCLI